MNPYLNITYSNESETEQISLEIFKNKNFIFRKGNRKRKKIDASFQKKVTESFKWKKQDVYQKKHPKIASKHSFNSKHICSLLVSIYHCLMFE